MEEGQLIFTEEEFNAKVKNSFEEVERIEKERKEVVKNHIAPILLTKFDEAEVDNTGTVVIEIHQKDIEGKVNVETMKTIHSTDYNDYIPKNFKLKILPGLVSVDTYVWNFHFFKFAKINKE
jgi:hypothetical protein